MHVCHGTILRGYKGSIVDGNSMTSLGRQRGGAGGMRAPVGVRETWSSMSSAALFDCCATVSLLAVAVGVLCVCVCVGGGRHCLVPQLLLQRSFEIGLPRYDMELIFVLEYRAILLISGCHLQ